MDDRTGTNECDVRRPVPTTNGGHHFEGRKSRCEPVFALQGRHCHLTTKGNPLLNNAYGSGYKHESQSRGLYL